VEKKLGKEKGSGEKKTGNIRKPSCFLREITTLTDLSIVTPFQEESSWERVPD